MPCNLSAYSKSSFTVFHLMGGDVRDTVGMVVKPPAEAGGEPAPYSHRFREEVSRRLFAQASGRA
jgi:hypothetical protein